MEYSCVFILNAPTGFFHVHVCFDGIGSGSASQIFKCIQEKMFSSLSDSQKIVLKLDFPTKEFLQSCVHFSLKKTATNEVAEEQQMVTRFELENLLFEDLTLLSKNPSQ